MYMKEIYIYYVYIYMWTSYLIDQSQELIVTQAFQSGVRSDATERCAPWRRPRIARRSENFMKVH